MKTRHDLPGFLDSVARGSPGAPSYLCRAENRPQEGRPPIVVWVFDCPCGKTHTHGSAEGHRVAHCLHGVALGNDGELHDYGDPHPEGYYLLAPEGGP